MPSSHLILCHPLLLLPPIPPSIKVFSNESTLRVRWPKYWSFSFSIIPSKETPGLISFTMDWLDLLAVQGTLKSLLQHHSSKTSILQRSAFFTVQLSHPYMTTPDLGGGSCWAPTGVLQVWGHACTVCEPRGEGWGARRPVGPSLPSPAAAVRRSLSCSRWRRAGTVWAASLESVSPRC